MEASEKKQIRSWALYDWGNSAYSTTVMAGFFPVFFKEYWSQGVDSVVTTARLGSVISIASLLVALCSPTLGVMADHLGKKKFFCLFFMLIGVLGCAWMGFIPMGHWQMAMLAYAVAMMAFNASSVFYDSLLPHVAQPQNMDYASSLGYALGYLGGGILFALNVAMYLSPGTFGIPDGATAIKLSFVSVGIWWWLFSLPLVKNVPEPRVVPSQKGLLRLTVESFEEIIRTIKTLPRDRNLFIFLLAYWLYIDGVYTVMTMAVDFGMSIGFEAKELIGALLLTQFIGFPSAYAYGHLGPRFGTRKLILIAIGMYIVTVVLATRMTEAWHFYLLASVVGMFQGGVQALSRSLFARMIPKEESGEYFGLFNLVGRFASIGGPLLVAIGVTLTGSNRLGMLGLIILLVVGGGLLLKVKEPSSAKHTPGV